MQLVKLNFKGTLGFLLFSFVFYTSPAQTFSKATQRVYKDSYQQQEKTDNYYKTKDKAHTARHNMRVTTKITLPGLLQTESYTKSSHSKKGSYYVRLGSETEAGWTAYEVETTREGVYELTVNASTFEAGRMLTLKKGHSETLSTINLPDTEGSWKQDFKTKITLTEGVYMLYLQVSQGAVDIDWIKFELIKPATPVSKVGNQKEKGLILMYPNLSTKELYIRLQSGHNLEYVDIIDKTGKVRHKQRIESHASQIAVQWKGLPPGDYFVRIYGKDKEVYLKRLLKIE